MTTSDRNGIICAGNWIVDIIHTIDRWPSKSELARIEKATLGIGGGAANVLSDLAAFDVPFPFWPVGRIGQDVYGDRVLEHCRRLGVDTKFLSQDETAPTAHTHVMNVPGDSRTFFYQGGANDQFSSTHIDLEALEKTGAKMFYLGYLMILEQLDRIGADGSTEGAKILKEAKRLGMTTCVDLVSVDHPDFQQVVSAALPHIDYLVINEIEAGRTLGRTVEDEPALCKAAKELLARGVGNAVIIHTSQAAVWATLQTTAFVSAVPIPAEKIISPVGAGDAFCAAVLVAIHEDIEPETALRLAHCAAGHAIAGETATGAIPTLETLFTELEET